MSKYRKYRVYETTAIYNSTSHKIDLKRFIIRTWLVLVFGAAFGVSSCSRQEPVQTTSDWTFLDVTEEVGLSPFKHQNGAAGAMLFPEIMGSGGGFVDLDGDEWIDIVLVRGGKIDRENRDGLWAYKNNQGKSFTRIESFTNNLNLNGYGFGIAAADYDNDGDTDLFYSTLGPNHLLRNTGGSFENITTEVGIPSDGKWSSSAMFFDADNDGFADLYVGNYVQWSKEKDLFCSLDGETKSYCTPELYEGVPGQFFRNLGDGRFADATSDAGFSTDKGKNLGISAIDFNRDGWLDLAVANDTDPDMLYQNDGDGTFTEMGIISGIAFDERGVARAGMGIDAGVVDDPGEETVFVGNFSNQMIGVYKHLGNGVFLDRAATSKIGRASLLTLTFGLFLFDVDLDGDLDLFAANGHVQPDIEAVKDNVSFKQPSHLFVNNGDGTFSDEAAQRGTVFQKPLVARGAAYADYDNDGDLDILVTENNGPVHLWQNTISNRNFIRVKLNGAQSGSDAIGARVELYTDDDVQVRTVKSGSSFLSSSEKVLTFGLGDSSVADSVIVHWPATGKSKLLDIAANQVLTIDE